MRSCCCCCEVGGGGSCKRGKGKEGLLANVISSEVSHQCTHLPTHSQSERNCLENGSGKKGRTRTLKVNEEKVVGVCRWEEE